jgi:hypothetical protein
MEAFDLRHSQTSHQLRHQLRTFEPSEEEFRTVFRLQHEIDLQYGYQWGQLDEEAQRQRRQAMEEMNNQISELLGEDGSSNTPAVRIMNGSNWWRSQTGSSWTAPEPTNLPHGRTRPTAAPGDSASA